MYSRSLSILHDSSVHKFAYATQIASTYIGRLDRFTRDIEVSCMLFLSFVFSFSFLCIRKKSAVSIKRNDETSKFPSEISIVQRHNCDATHRRRKISGAGWSVFIAHPFSSSSGVRRSVLVQIYTKEAMRPASVYSACPLVQSARRTSRTARL